MILSLQNISFAYGKRCLLHDISAELSPGRLHYLAGSNGCGKSTLLKLINGLLKPDNGRVLLNNTPLEDFSGSHRARIMGAVWQTAIPELDFTVREMVSIIASGRFSRWEALSSQAWQTVDEALNIFNMAPLADQAVNTLSGGERQRVMLAGIAALNPEIMLLDEPTSALDPAHRNQVMDFLEQYAQQHIVLAVTHDLELLGRAHGTLWLLDQQGNFTSGPAGELLHSELLSKVYGTAATVEKTPDDRKRIYFD